MVVTLLMIQGRHRRLIEKIIYLTVTMPHITFLVGLLSNFMHQPREVHWTAVLRILSYVKSSQQRKSIVQETKTCTHFWVSDSDYAGDKGGRKPTIGYYTFVGENLVTWRSKKQDVVSRSNAETEYKAMAHAACEMM